MSKFDYGSRFLYAEDLLVNKEYLSLNVKIEKVHKPGSLKTATGEKIEKRPDGTFIWAIQFEKSPKIFVLSSKTNMRMIHFLSGHEPGDGWIGYTIQLGVRVIDSFGKKDIALRVIPPVGTMVPQRLMKRLGNAAEWVGVAK